MEALLDFDRQITLLLNGSDSHYLDNLIMFITGTWTWIPVGIVLIFVLYRYNSRRDFLLLLLAFALCIFLADQVASGICKPYFKRFRPSQDPSLVGIIDLVNNYKGGLYGFFSSHAANTFSLFTFFSLYFRDKRFTLGLLSWTLLNGYSRIYLGVHYVGDVATGILWGAIVGTAIYYLFKIISNHGKSHYLRSTTTPPQGGIIVLYTLLATYAFILIASLF